jgi:membrane peptidoglycan carboxypeptidase
MIGSKDFFGEPYPENCIPGENCLFEPYPNVSLLGRQPGSAFKPFVYATAFKKGFDDKTVVVDEETNFGIWGGKPYIPQNYDGRFRGPVTLREALAQSLNVPSVKVLAYLAGLEDSIQTAKDFGITTLTQPSSWYGLALVLGGGEVKLLDMASSFSVFATDGLRVPPVSILKIEDDAGNIIEKANSTPKRILEAGAAQLINDILSDNQARAPIFGLRSPLYFSDYEVAVKTGTTGDFKDGWVIGYTPSIVAGVWVGNNDNTPMLKEPGVVVAGPLWHNFLEKALLKFPKENFIKPEIDQSK